MQKVTQLLLSTKTTRLQYVLFVFYYFISFMSNIRHSLFIGKKKLKWKLLHLNCKMSISVDHRIEIVHFCVFLIEIPILSSKLVERGRPLRTVQRISMQTCELHFACIFAILMLMEALKLNFLQASSTKTTDSPLQTLTLPENVWKSNIV